MIRVDEFTYLYHLKESKEYGYYELVPWVRKARIVIDLPSSFKYWKSQFFFMSGDDWETLSGEVWGDVPRLLRRWRILSLGASSFCKFSFILCSFPSYIIIIILIVANFPVCCVCVVKKRPKLKSKYRDRVEIAIEYIKTINDFDDLVDP